MQLSVFPSVICDYSVDFSIILLTWYIQDNFLRALSKVSCIARSVLFCYAPWISPSSVWVLRILSSCSFPSLDNFPFTYVQGSTQRLMGLCRNLVFFLLFSIPSCSYKRLGFLNSSFCLLILGSLWDLCVIPFYAAALKLPPRAIVMLAMCVTLLSRITDVSCMFSNIWKSFSGFWLFKVFLHQGQNISPVENYWSQISLF